MSNDTLKKVSEENFHKEVEDGLSLVDFFADWCGPCRMLTPVLERVAKNIKDKAEIIKLDIDHAQKIAIQYHVTSVPTLILFKNGKEIGRLVGLQDEETVTNFVLKEGK